MVLANIRAKMLNRRAERESGGIVFNLDIQRGDTIADIGSGGGYFTFEFSEKVGKDGRIYAVDTNSGLLDYIAQKLQTRMIKNVMTVVTEEDAIPDLDRKCDIIFLRNVFHHISNTTCYFQKLKSILTPTGKIVIIERNPQAGGIYASRTGHCTPESNILTSMEEAGFERWKSFAFLEQHSFNIFITRFQ